LRRLRERYEDEERGLLEKEKRGLKGTNNQIARETIQGALKRIADVEMGGPVPEKMAKELVALR
jgi:hypothetical protein